MNAAPSPTLPRRFSAVSASRPNFQEQTYG
jgi:hypothetical protein